MLKVNPSGLSRVLKCSGSPALIAQSPVIPHDRSNADEGVMAAKLAEQLLNDEMVVFENYPSDMVSYIKPYVEYVKSLGDNRLVEIKIECPTVSQYLKNGYADVIVVTDTHVHIIDLKYGYTEVPVIKNAQLGAYALALEPGYPDKQFVFHIWQARSFTDVHKVWDVPEEWLTSFREKVVSTLNKANGPASTLLTGEHCKYCSAKAVCPKLREEAYKAFDELAAIQRGISELTVEQESLYYSQLERFSRILKDSMTGIKESLTYKISKGQTSTLYEVREGLANRSWTIPTDTLDQMGATYGLKLTDKKPITPKEAERRGLKKELIDAMTTRKPTGYKLKKRNNKKAKEVFK